jgi:lipopolysaccharide export system protein LptA
MLLVVCVGLAGALFSQVQQEQRAQQPQAQEQAQKEQAREKTPPAKTPVDISANLAIRHPDLDQNAIVLTGEVVFHHNGTVIACDSAIRYSDRRIDCFGNVIINKDSTFVYGDRAEYNGDENLARVYSPVVKVVDGDATLYTYNFSFNTADNIGTYYGGGVMYQKGNTMESDKGYYYSDLREIVAVTGVEIKNEDYTMTGDSVRYNMDTKIANFYSKTYIWTTEGEIITADEGRYNTTDSTYFFHHNAYILTPTRETWADTIDYRAIPQDALLYGNVQIDDNENFTSAFGDFARYWGESGEVMLTRTPSVANYNEQHNGSDTLYMRADTIFMYVIPKTKDERRETRDESLLLVEDSLPVVVVDSLLPPVVDTLPVVVVDSLPVVDSLVKTKDERRKTRDERREARDERRKARAVARAQKRQDRASKRRLFDTLQLDTLPQLDTLARLDTLPRFDSLAQADTLPPPASQSETKPDTVVRTVRGWHNVKIWRTDLQAVCDSLVGFSSDSTIHLYKNPIMWHGESQIVCDSMTAFTNGEAIDRVEFYGNPLMGSVTGDGQFNQVKGRTMSSHFRDNAVYRHDVEGNAEAYYYIQEEGDPLPVAFIVATSSNMSFFFEERFVRYIVSRDNVTWPVYPISQIPAEQPTLLQGFKWMPELRPEFGDVFDRRFRPSEREFHTSLELPAFPIAERIDRRRNYLIDNRLWSDRTDPLPAYALDFVSSLDK